MAHLGPGRLAGNERNESEVENCPKRHQQDSCEPAFASAHQSNWAPNLKRVTSRGIQRALEGSWLELVVRGNEIFSKSRCERTERVYNKNGLLQGRNSACDSVRVALLALVVIISIELTFASVSLVARVSHNGHQRNHQTPLTPSLSSTTNKTSASDRRLAQGQVSADDGGTRCNHAPNGPGTNLQSAASRETSRIVRQDNDKDKGPIAVGNNQRRKRSNYRGTVSRLANDSTNDNNNGTGRICNDCLAIPLVALVGGRQINGFILQPTPSNLQAKLSPGGAAVGANGPANSDYEQRAARRVRGNFVRGNNQHYYSQAKVSLDIAAGENPDYENNPLDLANYNNLYPRYQPEIYHPRLEHISEQFINPFEPKSDDKCPMVGHVTVCDEIRSYPAEAILHKLNNLERALYKMHFNVDSLFSDESDNLIDPFELSTPETRPEDLMASARQSDESNYEKTIRINSNQYLAYGKPQTDDVVKASEVGAESTFSTNNRERNLFGQEAEGKNLSRSHSPRFESNLKLLSKVDKRVATSQVSRLVGSQPSELRSHDSLTQDESIRSPTNERSSKLTVNNWPELKLRSEQAAPRDRILNLVEQNGKFVGSTNSIHDVRPTKLASEKPDYRASGAHKAGASARQEKKSGTESVSGKDTRNDHIGPSGHEPKLATTTTTMTTIRASESSVKSGGHQLGASTTLSNPTNSVQTHKLSQRLNMVGARTNALGGTKAFERRPLNSVIAARRAQRNAGHGSVNDGHGDGALDRRATQRVQLSQQASATLARNNQEQGSPVDGNAKNGHQLNGGNAEVSGSLSPSSVSLATQSRAGGGSGVEASKVLTQNETNSVPAIRSRGVQLNLLSPKLATLFLSSPLSLVHDNAHQIELKSRPAQSGRILLWQKSDKLQPASWRFVTKKPTWARKPTELGSAVPKLEANLRAGGGLQVQTTLNGLERSRRQVSDSSSEQNNGDADGPERTRTDTVEQPPVSTSDDSGGQNVVPQPICRARSIYISPRAAMNDKKEWKYVVNAPERDPRIKQIIRVDICEAPFEPCSGDVTIPLGFISQCKQKYAKKKLLALDTRSGLLEVDSFFIPSCCVCQLVPDRSTESGGSPMSTVNENS